MVNRYNYLLYQNHKVRTWLPDSMQVIHGLHYCKELSIDTLGYMSMGLTDQL